MILISTSHRLLGSIGEDQRDVVRLAPTLDDVARLGPRAVGIFAVRHASADEISAGACIMMPKLVTTVCSSMP
jgi:hypothetical protein